MNYAKWLAFLVASGAVMGCSTPCARVASQAIALDKYCAEVAKEAKDPKLAVSCATAYIQVVTGLTEGTCANEVAR
jgi:hypothetical protein